MQFLFAPPGGATKSPVMILVDSGPNNLQKILQTQIIVSSVVILNAVLLEHCVTLPPFM